MKIKYKLKHKDTNEISYKTFTLNQIETTGLYELFDFFNYDIIDRTIEVETEYKLIKE